MWTESPHVQELVAGLVRFSTPLAVEVETFIDVDGGFRMTTSWTGLGRTFMDPLPPLNIAMSVLQEPEMIQLGPSGIHIQRWSARGCGRVREPVLRSCQSPMLLPREPRSRPKTAPCAVCVPMKTQRHLHLLPCNRWVPKDLCFSSNHGMLLKRVCIESRWRVSSPLAPGIPLSSFGSFASSCSSFFGHVICVCPSFRTPLEEG